MKKRIKWKHIFMTLLFILCLCLVLTTVFYLLIYPMITSYILTLTWLGTLVFSFSLAYTIWFIEYFIKEVR